MGIQVDSIRTVHDLLKFLSLVAKLKMVQVTNERIVNPFDAFIPLINLRAMNKTRPTTC